MFHDLLTIWLPKCCLGCGHVLTKKQLWLCVVCSHQLPKTYFEHEKNNILKAILRQHLPLESAYAPFYFSQNTPIQALLHALKYQGREKIADWLAEQSTLFIPKEHAVYSCDGIVPVPLHEARERKRGYNQVSRFGQFWATHLGVPYLDDVLLRKNKTKTLVRMTREDRWEEVKDAFLVQTKKNYKHLLLVDDVITTGATLTACGSTLLDGVCEKISVMGMAYAQNILP